MDISVIFVSYNTAQLTIEALDTLFESTGDFEMEVVIIDNASSDNSVEMIKQHYPHLKLIENDTNVGFGRANNQALEHISGDYVLLLNTDAFVEKDTLQTTLDYMKANKDVGLLGVRLIGRDDILQPSCRYFPTNKNLFMKKVGLDRLFPSVQMVDDMDWDHDSHRECDWVPGCYYLLRKEVVDQVGLFDKRYFLYYEEVDHCRAIKEAGWKIVYFAGATVVHIGGESAKSIKKINSVSRQVDDLNIESQLLFFRKYEGVCGLLGRVILDSLADIICLLKRLAKMKKPLQIGFHLKRVAKTFELLFKTKFGTQSTR